MGRTFVRRIRRIILIGCRAHSLNEILTQLYHLHQLGLLVGQGIIQLRQQVFLVRKLGLNFYQAVLVHEFVPGSALKQYGTPAHVAMPRNGLAPQGRFFCMLAA